MIVAIKKELVERQWLNDEDFIDIITLAQTAPGLFAVNIAILTGHKLRGTKGSVVATIASCLPPFLIILAVAVFFAVLSVFWDKGPAGIFAGALAGGLLGFLVYNFYPAKVFMGDTGSLFLGGAVCGLAFVMDAPLVLIPVGIVYIIETLSDIIQVGYFKLSHGKRVFRMAPLHHHLELGGWSEVRIVLTFTGITVAFCLLALAGCLNRYGV